MMKKHISCFIYFIFFELAIFLWSFGAILKTGVRFDPLQNWCSIMQHCKNEPAASRMRTFSLNETKLFSFPLWMDAFQHWRCVNMSSYQYDMSEIWLFRQKWHYCVLAKGVTPCYFFNLNIDDEIFKTVSLFKCGFNASAWIEIIDPNRGGSSNVFIWIQRQLKAQ